MQNEANSEAQVEAEEVNELKELLKARQILLDFQAKVPDFYCFGNYSLSSMPEEAQKLIADAKKHNESVASRAKRVLNDLIRFNGKQPIRVRPAPFISKEEERIIRTTLSLEPHIILLYEHLGTFFNLVIQSESQGLRWQLRGKRRREFEISLSLLNEIIAFVTGLVRLEEDVKRRLG